MFKRLQMDFIPLVSAKMHPDAKNTATISQELLKDEEIEDYSGLIICGVFLGVELLF